MVVFAWNLFAHQYEQITRANIRPSGMVTNHLGHEALLACGVKIECYAMVFNIKTLKKAGVTSLALLAVRELFKTITLFISLKLLSISEPWAPQFIQSITYTQHFLVVLCQKSGIISWKASLLRNWLWSSHKGMQLTFCRLDIFVNSCHRWLEILRGWKCCRGAIATDRRFLCIFIAARNYLWHNMVFPFRSTVYMFSLPPPHCFIFRRNDFK